MNDDLNKLIPKAVFGYMLVLQLLLPGVLFYLYGAKAKPLSQATWLEAFVVDDMLAITFYAATIGLVIAAVIVPRALLAKTAALAAPKAVERAAARHLPAYLVRLVLFESIVLMGFVLGFLHENPYAVAPFLVVGLLGTLASPPREAP